MQIESATVHRTITHAIVASAAFGIGLTLAKVENRENDVAERRNIENTGISAIESEQRAVKPDWDNVRKQISQMTVAELQKIIATDSLENDPLLSIELDLVQQATRNPETAFLAALNRSSDEQIQMRMASAVVKTIAATDPRLATELITRNINLMADGLNTAGSLLTLAFEAWAESDLSGLKEELLTGSFWQDRRNDFYHRAYSHAMAKRWPRDDLDGWIAFIARMTIPGEKNRSSETFQNTAEDFLHYHPRYDLTNLSDIIALPPNSGARDSALMFAIEHFMQKEHAISALDLLSPVYRDQAVAMIANEMAGEPLDQVIKFLDSHSDSSEWKATAVGRLMEFDPAMDAEAFAQWPDWAQKSVLNAAFLIEPAQRAEFASLVRDDSTQKAAMARGMEMWSRTDPVAASAWMSELPEGGTRDSALEGLVIGMAKSDPEAAAVLAGEITEPTMRARFQRLAFSLWMESDPVAAAREMPAAGLSSSVLESLLDRAEEKQEP